VKNLASICFAVPWQAFDAPIAGSSADVVLRALDEPGAGQSARLAAGSVFGGVCAKGVQRMQK